MSSNTVLAGQHFAGSDMVLVTVTVGRLQIMPIYSLSILSRGMPMSVSIITPNPRVETVRLQAGPNNGSMRICKRQRTLASQDLHNIKNLSIGVSRPVSMRNFTGLVEWLGHSESTALT